MFYSVRHSAALVKLYSEMFGEPIPESTGRKAAAGGRMQELMAAVDEATDSGEPIKDWSAFETQKAGAGVRCSGKKMMQSMPLHGQSQVDGN